MGVGRATHPTDLYRHRDCIPLLQGGGTLPIGPGERYPGSGHNAAFHADGVDDLAYHGNAAAFGGSVIQRIEILAWGDHGSPTSVNGSGTRPLRHPTHSRTGPAGRIDGLCAM